MRSFGLSIGQTTTSRSISFRFSGLMVIRLSRSPSLSSSSGKTSPRLVMKRLAVSAAPQAPKLFSAGS
jgi:hypothetical protein